MHNGSMNKLPEGRRLQVIRSLVEGKSLRATVRMTGVAMNTILKLLAEVGSAAETHQDLLMRNLSCKFLQVDEIWCGMKERQVPAELRSQYGYGDVWTWTAIDAETKLVPCWRVGKRNGENAEAFIAD